MKGYNTSNGYMGYVEGKYILFVSEQEYFEFMHYRGYIYVILELVLTMNELEGFSEDLIDAVKLILSR